MDVKDTDEPAYPLHYIGPTALDTLCDHLESEDSSSKSYTELQTYLQTLFAPAVLEVAENFKLLLISAGKSRAKVYNHSQML